MRLEGQFGGVRAAFEGGLTDGEQGVPGPVGRESPHTRTTWWEQRLALPVSWKISDSHTATFLAADVISKPGYQDPDGFYASHTRAQSFQMRAGDAWTSGDNRLAGFASYERGTVDSGSNYGVDLDNQHSTMWGVGLEDTVKIGGGVTVTAACATTTTRNLDTPGALAARFPGFSTTVSGRCGDREGQVSRAVDRRALLPVLRQPGSAAGALLVVRARRRALPAGRARRGLCLLERLPQPDRL